ncbi:Com family DNA-binding transcriptional regulator [Oleidesulfovibrio sp.]|uniref:Com family DNA-binding transcriptional regulator n=1 Tax=Oleidesulfovibrio sp. TaxID=2909707 RepID=UPI003A88F06C
MEEIRCAKCKKKIGEGELKKFEFYCPRCSAFNSLVRAIEPQPSAPREPRKESECGSTSPKF